MELTPLPSMPALRTQVHERLESLIISGALRPGERLVENDLAERLGVSRGPVREALQLLERDGWVDLKSRQGAFVHEPSEREVDDFFDVRRALEVEAARLAALRIDDTGAEMLKESLLTTTRQLLEQPEQLSEIKAAVSAADRYAGIGALHEQIAQLAGNEFLRGMLRRLSKRAAWYMGGLDLERHVEGQQEHAAIVDGICSGDPDAAAEAAAEHTRRTARAYKQRLAANLAAQETP